MTNVKNWATQFLGAQFSLKEVFCLNRLYNMCGGEKRNIQKYNINNGFVGGKNNKIKVIKRISYRIKKIRQPEKAYSA